MGEVRYSTEKKLWGELTPNSLDAETAVKFFNKARKTEDPLHQYISELRAYGFSYTLARNLALNQVKSERAHASLEEAFTKPKLEFTDFYISFGEFLGSLNRRERLIVLLGLNIGFNFIYRGLKPDVDLSDIADKYNSKFSEVEIINDFLSKQYRTTWKGFLDYLKENELVIPQDFQVSLRQWRYDKKAALSKIKRFLKGG